METLSSRANSSRLHLTHPQPSPLLHTSAHSDRAHSSPIFARSFPEGTRSKDGRIADFKKGPFTMASRAKVRIVPITIIGTHLFQPPGAFVPVAVPKGVRIVCPPPLDPPPEKKEDAALAACKDAIVSALPPSMAPA